MDKKAIIAQLVKLLEVNHIDCMEAKTILRNSDYVSFLTVANITSALFAYVRDNKLNHQQIENCKIIIDILDAIAE